MRSLFWLFLISGMCLLTGVVCFWLWSTEETDLEIKQQIYRMQIGHLDLETGNCGVIADFIFIEIFDHEHAVLKIVRDDGKISGKSDLIYSISDSGCLDILSWEQMVSLRTNMKEYFCVDNLLPVLPKSWRLGERGFLVECASQGSSKQLTNRLTSVACRHLKERTNEEATEPLMSVDEFAEKMKARYPDYADMDNYELALKLVEALPKYKNQVDFKKKEEERLSQGLPVQPYRSSTNFIDEQILKDFVTTAISANYDYDKVLSVFPELSGYDRQILKDYVTTAIEANYDYAKVNSVFPEFFVHSQAKGEDGAALNGRYEMDEETTLGGFFWAGIFFCAAGILVWPFSYFIRLRSRIKSNVEPKTMKRPAKKEAESFNSTKEKSPGASHLATNNWQNDVSSKLGQPPSFKTTQGEGEQDGGGAAEELDNDGHESKENGSWSWIRSVKRLLIRLSLFTGIAMVYMFNNSASGGVPPRYFFEILLSQMAYCLPAWGIAYALSCIPLFACRKHRDGFIIQSFWLLAFFIGLLVFMSSSTI